MFDYFFVAYKCEVYNKRNKITWEKLKKLKHMQKVILACMVLCFLMYTICAFFFKNSVLVAASFAGLIATTILAEVYTRKYNAEENKMRCGNYKKTEIDEIKVLLKRSEFCAFNSEQGIDFLINSCQDMILKKTIIESMVTIVLNIFKIVAIPVALAVFSIQIKNMSVYEASVTAAAIVIFLIIVLCMISISFFPLGNLFKRNRSVAAELSGALKYIKLTVGSDAKDCAKLIL